MGSGFHLSHSAMRQTDRPTYTSLPLILRQSLDTMPTTFQDPTVHYVSDTLFRAAPGALPLAALSRAIEDRHGVRLSLQRLRDLGSRYRDQFFLLEGFADLGRPSGSPETLLEVDHEETGPWLILREKQSEPEGRDAHPQRRLLARISEALSILAEETDVTSRLEVSRWILLGLEARALFRRVTDPRAVGVR